MMLTVKGVTQTGVNPPTFVFKVNNTKLVHFSYRRFLEINSGNPSALPAHL